MRILTITILIIILLFFEVLMFDISWELGISSLVLILTISCIWFVLKKITTIVMDPDFALTSEPFRNSKKLGSNIKNANVDVISESTNLIPGLDGSIFEKFKNNVGSSTQTIVNHIDVILHHKSKNNVNLFVRRSFSEHLYEWLVDSSNFV